MLTLVTLPITSFALATAWAVFDKWQNERICARLDHEIAAISREIAECLIQQRQEEDRQRRQAAYDEAVARFEAEMRLSAANLAKGKQALAMPVADIPKPDDAPYPVYRYRFRDDPNSAVLSYSEADDYRLFAVGYFPWERAPSKAFMNQQLYNQTVDMLQQRAAMQSQFNRNWAALQAMNAAANNPD